MTHAMLLYGDSDTNQNLLFKTHFLAEGLVYIEREGQETLITSAMERGRAEKEARVSNVRTFDEFGWRELSSELNDRRKALAAVLVRAIHDVGVDTVVVQPDFPVLLADALRAEGVHLQIDAELLVMERRQKSDGEIAAIEEAQQATERATQGAVEMLRACEDHRGILHFNGIPLTSERLSTEIEIALIREGMDVSAAPIVAGGPGASDPHWLGSGPLRTGESIVLDIFPRGKRTRYWADMTRTVVKGAPSDALKIMYETVARAQDAALHEIRAGVKGSDVHTVVEAVFRDAGYAGEGPGPRYLHGTGHGVGLAIHESPSLGAFGDELRANDVVTVEPGLYDPEVGAIRLEDMVVVTDNGCRNLTRFPRQFEL